MAITFDFEFDDFEDFQSFMEKHEQTIDAMGQGQDKLSDQIIRQVVNNQQLPEDFTFTDEQYKYMIRRYHSGMQKMVNDNRVNVHRNRGSDD